MLKSMTGYGRGECIRYDRRIKVEIKSVNHRFCDVTIKLPRFLNPMEDKMRKRLAADIIRGKVDLWVTFESFAHKDVAINVNKALADAYVEALSGLSSRYKFGPLQASPALDLLAKNPDIITIDKFDSSISSDSDMEELWETLHCALEAALEEFNHMRIVEGQAMVEDIRIKCRQVKEIVEQISLLAPIAQTAHAERYKERVMEIASKLGQKIDDPRIVTELAIFADKGCISEEIARLQSHFTQLETMLFEKEPIGRKLDFLVQELNREANTIGSKSGDVGVTSLVVELKSQIEKMREQAQNIE